MGTKKRQQYIIGVDLGGTNIVVGAMSADGKQHFAMRSIPTSPESGAEGVADRPGHRERQRRHVGAEHDTGGVGAEKLTDGVASAIHQSLAFLRGGERTAIGGGVAAGHPIGHCRDRRVDHLSAGRPVEPDPAVLEPREAFAIHRA